MFMILKYFIFNLIISVEVPAAERLIWFLNINFGSRHCPSSLKNLDEKKSDIVNFNELKVFS